MIRLVEDRDVEAPRQCDLRDCLETVGGIWTPFYEVTSQGEPPARFCVVCGDWLREAMRAEVTS